MGLLAGPGVIRDKTWVQFNERKEWDHKDKFSYKREYAQRLKGQEGTTHSVHPALLV